MQVEQCDYREDKIINGVLCFSLDGEWIEYSKAELTEMYMFEQGCFDSYIDGVLAGSSPL